MQTHHNAFELLQHAQYGDSNALNEVLKHYRPNIRRYAQLHCALSDVDDAVQETLLIITKKIHAVRHLTAFSSWLFRIVQFECRRLARKTLKYDPYDETILDARLAHYSQDELRLTLAKVLENLPFEYRQIILMRDFMQLTMQEIANTLELSIPASKSRLHRARKLAREHLLAN